MIKCKVNLGLDFFFFPSSSQPIVRPQPSKIEKAKAEAKVKSKSFAELVRLQRPEVTRKWKEMNAQRRVEEEEMARRAQQEEYNKAAAQMYQTEKQKIYGNVYIDKRPCTIVDLEILKIRSQLFVSCCDHF